MMNDDCMMIIDHIRLDGDRLCPNAMTVGTQVTNDHLLSRRDDENQPGIQ